MYPLVFTGGVVLIWASALLNDTGLGSVYQTDLITIAAFGIFCLLLILKKRTYRVPSDIFLSIGGMILIFVGSSLFHGFGWTVAEYFSCFVMIYIIANVKVRDKSMHMAGVVVLLLGTAILLIYDYGTQLSGWNGNSIAMIGLFSYLIFVAAFWNSRSHWHKLMLLLVGGGEFWLLVDTDSRSCQVSLLIMALILLIRSVPKVLHSKRWLLFILLLPLAIAVVTSLLSTSGIVEQMDTWSRQTFSKPIFNGRDETWRTGFQQLWQHPFFGNGNIDTLRWHNSAVACLVSFGIAGYGAWISSLYALLQRGRAYLMDPIVSGCMISFLLVDLQQAVELGMFTQNPNLMIYLPLGLMLGRINYLKGEHE